MSLLRRFTALLVTLLLIQANWQESGAACVTGHAASHHEAAHDQAASSTALPTGGAVAAHAAMGHEAMAHDGTLLRRAPDNGGNARASSPTGTGETLPSHCPDSGMPPDCAAMVACSAADVSTAVGPLLAPEGLVASERVIAPDARPHSRHTAPDVPPPRA